MPSLAKRPLLTALVLSMLFHLFLLFQSDRLWTGRPLEMAFPIEASLLPEAVPEPDRGLPPVPNPASPAKEAPTTVSEIKAPDAEPIPLPAATPETPPAPVEANPEPKTELPVAPPLPEASERRAEPVPQAGQEEDRGVPTRPAWRKLPPQLEIRYGVQYGEAGFRAGQARYIWHSRGEGYSLVSTLEATGLASLFVSGRIVQVSEGEIAAGGLQPAQYWLQQGDKRQDTARFLWLQNQLILGAGRGSVDLTPQAQDLLSFPFHLAMTAREGESEFALGISNGRKFQEYRFQVIGVERLEIAGSELETLHLRGQRPGAGTLDVWLDRDNHGLPVRIRTLDQKGKQAVLTAEEITLKH